MTIQTGATHSVALQFLTAQSPLLPTGSADLPASGDDVSYEFTPAASGSGVVSAGGQPIWSVSEDTSGVLVVTTFSESLPHKRLGDLLSVFTMGKQATPFSMSGVRLDNGDSFQAQQVWIQQKPVIRSSATAQVVTWTMWCGATNQQYGRAIPDGAPV
jgi:hypothetical protein